MATKLTPKAPPSPTLTRLRKQQRVVAREKAALDHLVAIEEAQRVGLRRRRLVTLAQATFHVEVDSDGGPMIEGTRVMLNEGKAKTYPLKKTNSIARAIFDLADGKPPRLSSQRTKKLNVILAAWGLCVKQSGGGLVLAWRPDARSERTPVFRRGPKIVAPDQEQAHRRPKGHKQGDWRGVRWEALLQATDVAPEAEPRRTEPTSGHKKVSPGHKRTKPRTTSTQPPARSRRRGAKP